MTSARPTTAELDYFVEGMDCPSCVRKIEGALQRLPGASQARTNLTRQSLTLTLDETRTSRQTLEATLRGLGHIPHPLGGPGSAPPAPRPWYRAAQGQLVLGSGALLAAAFLLGLLTPALAPWAYGAATVLGVAPLARKAVAAARAGDPFSINTLVTLAAVGALLIGEYAEAAVVVFLFAVGELLEGVAVGRARSGIQALAALAPKTALLLRGDRVLEVPADALRAGQTVQIQPGGRVPADGTILDGQSSLDDSPVTGESVPVFKGPGDPVYAGSVNAGGVLRVRVDREASDNTIARIIHLVEQAEASRAPVARFIDRFSRVYTPIVVLVAALTAFVPPLLGASLTEWVYKGVALLLIGCPCALVLSVPAAITSAVSAGARRGLLIKGGAALEAIGTVRTVAFDKTGTLTAGQPQVTDVTGLGQTEAQVLTLAAAAEQGSSHPLGRAILAAHAALGTPLPVAEAARALPGQAALAHVDGREVAVASPRYARQQADLGPLESPIAALEDQGKTVVVLLVDGAALGLIALRDEPRPDARAAVQDLRALGVTPVMLTGDNARTGQAVARSLGLEVHADLLPEDKLRLIRDLQRQGGVAMIGDGINDAPALAAADVGVAMGGGTDVALETAHAALLRPQVSGAADLIRLSRATMRVIRQNVAFAVGLKLVFLITTLLGITGLWPAVLSDTGATALVTANALRLLRFRPADQG
ncbi:heavy metal translocating P-type ATPase [Deinococcus sp. JMULE3]|uniref:heavy metal translocating P-type ATPase n=1 Tax=Deinococcus sp. JMULE3 TaxID=2518341 RepID=UPI0015766EFC|nr:heavy metal translocating P-type ATPase [Deinococcus sp. JMULE3]NTX99046.1 cadmium-translocating P-type ATPase [Deinococcus sp. JMULE3]